VRYPTIKYWKQGATANGWKKTVRAAPEGGGGG
jgi:hypothetical protein